MADSIVAKSLDPKLRRLVRSLNDPARLRLDRRHAFIAAAPEAAAPGPSDHSKRVFVQVDRDRPPTAFSEFKWHRLVDGVYTVDVPITRLSDIADHAEVKFVESGRRMTLALDTSIPAATVDLVHAVSSGSQGFHGSGVVIGLIDIGFDFTLADFTDAHGKSRVEFLWDQSLTPQGTESAPVEFGYGVQYMQDDIEEARQAADPFLRVRHKPDMGAHGTHVAGIAAGNGNSADAAFPSGKYIGVADAATLILVQPGIDADEGRVTDSTHVADAVEYIFTRAEQLAKPCVINVSLGQNGGSHDGESIVERAFDRLLERAGRSVVVAAGNEHIWRTHASGTLTQGTVRALKWRVGTPPIGFPPLPGTPDGTPNEMEIWYSSRDILSVRVIDPAGNAAGPLLPDTVGNFTLGNAQVYIDSERFTVLNGDARIYIEISSTTGAVQSGTWTVELTAVAVLAGRFDAWIERDQRNALNGFVDQSSFEDADFDPSMTIGTPATARRTIAVANYDHRLTTISDSSGRGPTRDGRHKPECTAPGTAILSTCALGARSQNGSVAPVRIAISGTSMAAPHVTGIVALLFERALALPSPRLLSAEQVRKIITATTSAVPGVQGFDPAWGFGRVDAEAAVQLVK